MRGPGHRYWPRVAGAGGRHLHKGAGGRRTGSGGTRAMPKSAPALTSTTRTSRSWASSTDMKTSGPACSAISLPAGTGSGADPFDFSIWGKNVGWDDQAFGLDPAKPGTYYSDLLLGRNPARLLQGRQDDVDSGGNVLSTPTYLPFPPPTCEQPTLSSTPTLVSSLSASAAIRRAVKGRWTPDDNWDITADYSHMHRHGTQR